MTTELSPKWSRRCGAYRQRCFTFCGSRRRWTPCNDGCYSSLL